MCTQAILPILGSAHRARRLGHICIQAELFASVSNVCRADMTAPPCFSGADVQDIGRGAWPALHLWTVYPSAGLGRRSRMMCHPPRN